MLNNSNRRAGTIYIKALQSARATIIAVLLALTAVPSLAQSETYQFDIPAQTLDSALRTFAHSSRQQILFEGQLVRDKRSAALVGNYSIEAALAILLQGTGLNAKRGAHGAFVILTTGDATAASIALEQIRLSQVGDRQAQEAAEGASTLQTDQSDSTAESADRPSGKSPVLDAQNTSSHGIQEIIVTAQKRAERLIDVPISISALSEGVLKERGIEDFTDLSLAVPDLKIWDVGGAGNRGLFIRGVGNIRGTGSAVGMYVDEASITGSPLNQVDVRMYDLERVEVLRGPQGTLYGEGSMGGTVRFITKDPQFNRFVGKGEVAAAFMEDGDPSRRFKSAVNIPLVEDRVALRVAATYEDVGGWIEQPAIPRSDINDQEVMTVRVKGLWQANESLQVRTLAIVHRADTGAPNHGEDAAGNYTAPFGSTIRPSTINDYNLYNATLNYDFSSVRLTATSTYIDQFQSTHARGLFAPVLGLPPATPFAILYGGVEPNDNDVRQTAYEVRLNSKDRGFFNWTAGAFYRSFHLAGKGTTLIGLATAPAAAPARFSSASESWALFGEASFALSERLELGAGLRYFKDDRESSNFLTRDFQSGDFDALNPRFSASYSITPNIKTYASAARGFRSGGFNVGGLASGRPPYDPESIWTYELGTKMALQDGRLNAELALFFSDYKQLQMDSINLVNGQLRQFTTNSGRAEIKGLDFNVSWYPIESLSLGVGGTKVDAVMKEANPLGSNLNVGDPLDLIPEYDLTVWARYDHRWFAGLPGYLRADYNEQGKSFFTNRTIGPWYHAASDVINMLNFLVGVEKKPWTLEIFAKNLLDDRGYVDADILETFASRAPPRSVGIRFSVDFE